MFLEVERLSWRRSVSRISGLTWSSVELLAEVFFRDEGMRDPDRQIPQMDGHYDVMPRQQGMDEDSTEY